MTDDSILQRYIDDQESSIDNQSEYADDDEQIYPASFGWLRGIRDRALMLELRKKNGNIMAFGYSWLERVEFNPSEGITLIFGERNIQIRGRNLNIDSGSLFDSITRHKATWIQEALRADIVKSCETETVIESIEWE